LTKRDVGLLALVVLVIALMFWRPVVRPLLHREQYRQQVRALYANLQPGMSKQQVSQEMDSGKYPALDFHREGELWLGSAPFEFGAGNWVLAIEFKGDQVLAVRIRTGDGLQEVHHPGEAPPDKTRSSEGSG
jgi:hypothetical protein